MTIRSRISAAAKVAAGARGFILELSHDGLGRRRRVRGTNEEIVRRKAALQAAEWDARWEVVEGRRQGQAARLAAARHANERRALASELTALAQQDLQQLATLLKFTLAVYDPVDWEMLKNQDLFAERRPQLELHPAEPAPPGPGREPREDDPAYRPAPGFLDRLFGARRAEKSAARRQRFTAAHELWAKAAAEHAERLRAYFARLAHRTEAHDFQVAAWEDRKRQFLLRKAAVNAAADEIRAAYMALVPHAVTEYCDLVLSQSQVPDCLPREFEVEYAETATGGMLLVVDYLLPRPADLPTLQAVEYVEARDEFAERHLGPASAAALYARVLCQLALRTLHELFSADTAGALDSIVFNGRAAAGPPAEDPAAIPCILSLRVRRAEFQRLHLAQIDPEPCLRALGGVAGERLHELTPVTPLAIRSAPTSAGHEPSATP